VAAARPKGGLYGFGWARAFSELIVVERLLDLAELWQAGFPQAVAALGCHLHPRQWAQLTATTGQRIYVCFDGDASGTGAAQQVCQRLRQTGVEAWPVRLPAAIRSGQLVRRRRRCRGFPAAVGGGATMTFRLRYRATCRTACPPSG
jgi:DNA primase